MRDDLQIRFIQIGQIDKNKLKDGCLFHKNMQDAFGRKKYRLIVQERNHSLPKHIEIGACELKKRKNMLTNLHRKDDIFIGY